MADHGHAGLYVPAPFAVRIRTGAEATVAVQGELDIATVALFEAVVSAIDVASVRRVVLDLGALDFIDVPGLRAVLALRTACLRASVALAILPGPRRVQRVFELVDRLLAGRRP